MCVCVCELADISLWARTLENTPTLWTPHFLVGSTLNEPTMFYVSYDPFELLFLNK